MTIRPGTATGGDDSFAAKLAELFEHSRDENGHRYTGTPVRGLPRKPINAVTR